ncbi:MAG: hypothetical protein AAFO83_00015 [Cyanobacteria bacterium J06607_13]
MVMRRQAQQAKRLYLTLEGHVPSKKNSLRRISRWIKGKQRTITVPSKAHENWEKEEVISLRQQLRLLLAREGLKFPVSTPCRITYRFYPGNLQDFDLSNSVESINDLLVKTKIIGDDNWRILQWLDIRVAGFDRQAPRVDIEIRSLRRTAFDDALDLLKSFLADRQNLREYAASRRITQKAAESGVETMLSVSVPSTEDV